jgi:SagB-type dehydrogenase family enzyme
MNLLLAAGLRRLTPLLLIGATFAADLPKPIDLPPPQTDGGKPLMQTLKERRSSRDFNPTAKLAPQVLSNLLWAAAGISRPDGRRTAPTAMNRQEIDVYVATADGLYRYEPAPHRLVPVAAGDQRAATGTQAFVTDAAVNLVFVADFARMGQSSSESKLIYSSAATGFISQNVYLYCASAGLATVVRASVDQTVLPTLLKLGPDQRIILAQSVGYPK